MKNLLIVTDHRFYEYEGEIYDNYVFDYGFFKDYLSVFELVIIIARVHKLSELPKDYLQTTGKNLKVIKVRDIRGLKWLFFNKKYLNESDWNLSDYDAICYRIPSLLAFSVWRKAIRYKIPHMFEMIGHPTESLNFSSSFIKKNIFKALTDEK